MSAFWLAVGNRVMHTDDYQRGTIIESANWQKTGEVVVQWDRGPATRVSKFDLEPVDTENN